MTISNGLLYRSLLAVFFKRLDHKEKNKFTLKNVDKKGSTLKSLAPKRRKKKKKDKKDKGKDKKDKSKE